MQQQFDALPITNVTDPDTINTKAGSYSKLDDKLLKTFFSLRAQTPTLSKHKPQIYSHWEKKVCKQAFRSEVVLITQHTTLTPKIEYLRQQLISVLSRRNFLVFLIGILSSKSTKTRLIRDHYEVLFCKFFSASSPWFRVTDAEVCFPLVESYRKKKLIS